MLLAILIVCDRDTLFREALRNFLLTAGYSQVEVAVTVREAISKLRHERYRCIVVGLSRPSHRRRLARVAQQRQPGAKVVLVVNAGEVGSVKDNSFVYVIKERAFSTLVELLVLNANDDSAATKKRRE